jgi:hypothetical protein
MMNPKKINKKRSKKIKRPQKIDIFLSNKKKLYLINYLKVLFYYLYVFLIKILIKKSIY